MLKISRRVAVYAGDSERVPLIVTERYARKALTAGQVRVNATNAKGEVVSVRITEQRINLRQLDVRAGSFGIRREETAFGIVFAHHRHLYAAGQQRSC